MALTLSFFLLISHVAATSMKMDFLSFADVRTDPIVAPTELSDHVHTFYGATVARPETTYEDLRNAYGGSGNVVENMSLYWHPTIYRVLPDGTHVRAEMTMASTYYIWTTGEATAFPDGFKMIAFVPEDQANTWFPSEPSLELETEMVFPDCWDGVNIDSPNHMDHVAYSAPDESVDEPCPATHPVRIPKIAFFVRLRNYMGGPHVFSDGTTRMHADYFSGWKQSELQNVLDNCRNYSFASNPDAFCENFVTFKDAGPNGEKEADPCATVDSEQIKVAKFQPPPLDTSTITDEVIDFVKVLPRGEGTGTLKFGPDQTLVPAPSLAPAVSGCDGDDEEGNDEDGVNDGNEEEEEEEEGGNDEEEEEEEDDDEQGGDDEEEEEEGEEDEDGDEDEENDGMDGEEDENGNDEGNDGDEHDNDEGNVGDEYDNDEGNAGDEDDNDRNGNGLTPENPNNPLSRASGVSTESKLQHLRGVHGTR